MSTGSIQGQAVHLKEKSTDLNQIIMGLIYFQRQDPRINSLSCATCNNDPHLYFTSHSHLKLVDSCMLFHKCA